MVLIWWKFDQKMLKKMLQFLNPDLTPQKPQNVPIFRLPGWNSIITSIRALYLANWHVHTKFQPVWFVSFLPGLNSVFSLKESFCFSPSQPLFCFSIICTVSKIRMSPTASTLRSPRRCSTSPFTMASADSSATSKNSFSRNLVKSICCRFLFKALNQLV